MASKSRSRTLTDHEEIRRWAEERHARPAVVRSTHGGNGAGIIRLDFPSYPGQGSLEEIEWDEWFTDFDENGLALVVQDQTSEGEQSNFNKLVNRENIKNYSAETSKTSRTETSRKMTLRRGGKEAKTNSQHDRHSPRRRAA